MTDALGMHVLDALQDLLDDSRNLDLSDVFVGRDDIQKLAAGGQLRDQGHAVLVIVHLY